MSRAEIAIEMRFVTFETAIWGKHIYVKIVEVLDDEE
jgi:hypothetical protein